jgi:hypothetical protein
LNSLENCLGTGKCLKCKVGKLSKLNGCDFNNTEETISKFSLYAKYTESDIRKIQDSYGIIYPCACVALHHNKLFEEEKEYRDKMKAILE